MHAPVAASFVDGERFPPLELSLHNALRYGAFAHLQILGAPILPRTKYIDRLNVDGRFREKLIKRRENRLVNIFPAWSALDCNGERSINHVENQVKSKSG